MDTLGLELRKLHPGLIIGSRFRADEYGKRHYDSNGDLIDDYDQTWERDLPNSLEDLNGSDWDCVMTIPENQWGYHAEWRGDEDIIRFIGDDGESRFSRWIVLMVQTEKGISVRKKPS